MANKDKAYIVTYTGKQFWLLEPRIQDVDVKDIAHALSLQCRWTGHCKHHYSIAQHAYYCSLLGPETEAFARLNHDNSEAYMGDMNRPLKHYTAAGPAYRRQEAVVQDVIKQAFGLAQIDPPSVHRADEVMLFTELAQIVAPISFEPSNPWAPPEDLAKIEIEEWTPKHAEQMFLQRFQELYKRRIN